MEDNVVFSGLKSVYSDNFVYHDYKSEIHKSVYTEPRIENNQLIFTIAPLTVSIPAALISAVAFPATFSAFLASAVTSNPLIVTAPASP